MKEHGTPRQLAKSKMSTFTLQYPAKIAEEIGLSPNQINNFKKHGCRFFGRKTSVAWVREHLDRVTKAVESESALASHPQHSTGSIFDARGR